MTMKQIFVQMTIDEIRLLMNIKDPKQPLLESEIRVEDLIHVYSNWDGNAGDLHVLCTMDVDWNYSLIQSKLLMFLHGAKYQDEGAIAQAIVKEVIHFV